MYHNQPNMIELHDDVVGVEKSHLEVKDGQPVRLHVSYIMRPDRRYIADKNADVRLHSTNGVNHRYIPLNSPDPNLDLFLDGNASQPVENGQNRSVVYDGAGDPFMAVEPVTSADQSVGAPLEQGEQRHYRNLSYYDADFNENETDATRNMRRQQDLVDRTTAKKRADGAGAGTPANSMREKEAKREEEKNDRREVKQEEKREEKKDK